MIADLAKRLTGLMKVRERDRFVTLRELATAVVDETTTDEHEILAALDAIDQTPDSLQTEIDRIAERRRLQSQVVDEPRLRKELAKIEADLAAFEATRLKAAQVATEESQRLNGLRSRVDSKLDIIGRAKARLLGLADNQTKDDLDQAQANVRRLNREIEYWQAMLSTNNSNAVDQRGGGYRRVASFFGRRAKLQTEISDKERQRNSPDEFKFELAELRNNLAAAEAEEKQAVETLARLVAERESQQAKLDKLRADTLKAA